MSIEQRYEQIRARVRYNFLAYPNARTCLTFDPTVWIKGWI